MNTNQKPPERAVFLCGQDRHCQGFARLAQQKLPHGLCGGRDGAAVKARTFPPHSLMKLCCPEETVSRAQVRVRGNALPLCLSRHCYCAPYGAVRRIRS